MRGEAPLFPISHSTLVFLCHYSLSPTSDCDIQLSLPQRSGSLSVSSKNGKALNHGKYGLSEWKDPLDIWQFLWQIGLTVSVEDKNDGEKARIDPFRGREERAVFFREKPGSEIGLKHNWYRTECVFASLFSKRSRFQFALPFLIETSVPKWPTVSRRNFFPLSFSGPRVFRNWRGQCYFDSVNFPFLSLSRAPHSINHLGPRARVSIFALPISHFFTAIWPQIHISDNWTHFPLIRIGLDRGKAKDQFQPISRFLFLALLFFILEPYFAFCSIMDFFHL